MIPANNRALTPSALTKVLVSLHRQRANRVDGAFASDYAGRPLIRESIGDHFQGVARCGGTGDGAANFFVTTSAENGLLLRGRIEVQRGEQCAFLIQESKSVHPASAPPDSGKWHPGGIQTAGEYVVVPVYSQAGPRYSEIQIWSPRLVRCEKTLVLNENAYCLGITNVHDLGHLLAVSVKEEGDRIRLFRTEDELSACNFGLVGTATVVPGCPNSMSLIADTDNNVYLLALYLCGEAGVGDDIVQLYRVGQWEDLLVSGNRDRVVKLVKIGSECNVKCEAGAAEPSFRWGGSAHVMGDENLEVIAIGVDSFKRRSGVAEVFQINTFEG